MRWQWRWLVIVSLAVLTGLAVAPRTGWLARTQLDMLVHQPIYARQVLAELNAPMRAGESALITRAYYAPLLQAARRQPHNLGAQIVAATIAPDGSGPAPAPRAVEHLRALASAPGNRTPELWAAIVRYEAPGVQLGRENEQRPPIPGRAPAPPAYGPKPASAPERFYAVLDAANAGEAADPGNAFFPVMEAAVLFGLHRDTDALGALHRAAGASRWDDGALAQIDATLRVQHETFGRRGALAEMCIQAAVLYPHFSVIRQAARLALFDATQTERAGDRVKGLAIRHDLMQLGARMRTNSSAEIGALVGASIAGIATERPGGSAPSGGPAEVTPGERPARREQSYLRYLRTIGHPDEARWAAAQLAAGHEAGDIARRGLPRSILGGPPLWRLMLGWDRCMAALALAASLLVLAGACAWLGMRKRSRPVTLAVFAAALALIGAQAWLQSINATSPGQVIEAIEDLAFGGHAQEMAKAFTLHELWISLQVFAAWLWVPAVVAGVPALLLGGTTIVCVVRRARVVPGVKIVALYAVLVCMVLYALLAFRLVGAEDRASADLARMRQHEGRYLASLVGKPWPPAEP